MEGNMIEDKTEPRKPSSKMVEAAAKALKKCKEAKTFTKIELRKAGFKCLDFDAKKGEYHGVVDLVAIRRDNKHPDNLEIILFQVKGGSSKIGKDEKNRLKEAVKYASTHMAWNISEKPKKKIEFGKIDFLNSTQGSIRPASTSIWA